MPSRPGDLVDLLSGQRKVSENQSPLRTRGLQATGLRAVLTRAWSGR